MTLAWFCLNALLHLHILVYFPKKMVEKER